MGAFDDLVPGDGAFDDLVPAAPQKRKVGALEAYPRGVSKAIGEAGSLAGRALTGAAIPIDFLASLFGAEPGAITDRMASVLVEPSKRNIEFGTIKPDEELTTGGAVAYGGGQFVGMAPEIAAGGPGRASMERLVSVAPKVAETVAPLTTRIAPEVATAIPSAAVRGVSRSEELQAQGIDPVQAGIAGVITSAVTPLMFAMPASMPGGLATRVLTGAGGNVATGAGATAAENLALPAQARTDPLSENSITDAILGAVFGAFGERAPSRLPTPGEMVADRARVDAAEAQARELAAGYQRWGDLLAANGVGPDDPRAPDLIRRLDERAAARAEAEAAARANASPQERELADKARPPETVVVDQQGRAGPVEMDGTRAGVLSAEGTAARSEKEAQGAVDLAARQAKEKQDALDLGSMTEQPRDLRDVSAGGTSSEAGTAAMQPETFTFLDVKRDANGNVTQTGPQVQIIQDGLTIKAGEKEIPAVEISYENPDGSSVTAVVPADRVEALSRPKNPRFAQDVAERTYSPPEGVGTGEQQPQPREAAQRITPEREPAQLIRAGDEAQTPPARQPDTIDSTATRVQDPALLEDNSRGLPDNGERTPLLTNEPRKLEGPETVPLERRLPGPDTPRGDGQMVAGPDGVRPQTYGDTQRTPGEPYKRPFQGEPPVVGAEENRPPPPRPEINGAAEARARDRVGALEAEKRSIEDKPLFQRTAEDKVRLRAIDSELNRLSAERNGGKPPKPIETAPASRQKVIDEQSSPNDLERNRVSEGNKDLTPEQSARLEDTPVDLRVREAESGKQYRLRMSAKDALEDVNERLRKALALWECLHA